MTRPGEQRRVEGKWRASPTLRWEKRGNEMVLQQRMARRVKFLPPVGVAWTTMEHAWLDIPIEVKP